MWELQQNIHVSNRFDENTPGFSMVHYKSTQLTIHHIEALFFQIWRVWQFTIHPVEPLFFQTCRVYLKYESNQKKRACFTPTLRLSSQKQVSNLQVICDTMVDEGVAYLRTLVAGFGCSTCLDPQVFVTLPFFPLHCVEPFTAAFSVFLLFSGGGGEEGASKCRNIWKL